MLKNKLIVSLLSLFMLLFVTAGTSFASTSVRLEQPNTQTNNGTFDITFVALDTTPTQTVTVDCYKHAPGDSGYSVFESFSLPNGGNTNNCHVTSATTNKGDGTYSFYATATGTSSVQSQTVSVELNTSTPGIPTGYSKEKTDSCTYKISFKTADDSGKTVRVELYRSTDLNFNADSGHKVNSVNIGSNTDGSMTDNISPNCNTNYYYAIRAFDTYGNGSGVVGDSSSETTTVNPTGTPTEGAIALSGNLTKSVLGSESANVTPTPAMLNKGTNPIVSSINWIANHKKIDLLILIVIAAIAYYIYRRYYKKTK